MKRAGYFLTAVLFLAGVPTLSGHAQVDKKTHDLMRKKLDAAQKVLEGIAVNNPNLIALNARELIEISKAVEWRVLKSPQYELHSNDFRRSASALVEAAKEKNVDAAALAYVDLTLSCVRCHKHVREVRQTRLPADPFGRPATAVALGE
jgi:hypothetical protein